jgi:uncharacterized lipoprotein YmbA
MLEQTPTRPSLVRLSGALRMCAQRYGGALAALALLMLLGGCASTPSSFYTLTPIPQAAAGTGNITDGGIAVGLGPVVFPQFLDRPQIVTRDGTNQLAVDEFHRWGGTVHDDFLRVWGENLAYLLGTSRIALFPSESRMSLDFRVPAEVVAFEGSATGDAVLKVRWSVMDERRSQTFVAREDFYRCPIGGTAAGSSRAGRDAQAAATARNAAVVAAMSNCLGEFSRDVADAVRILPKPQPPAPPAPPAPLLPPAATPAR